MTLNINQFAMSTVQGERDLLFSGCVVSARVSPNQVTALIAGQAVKIENLGTLGLPNVLATTSNLDVNWGVVLRNQKDQSFPANAAVEIARDNTVVYLTASAAIARGKPVMLDFAAFTVSTWDGVSAVVGEAYDAAVNSGDLIRVWIRLPKNGNTPSLITAVADVTATLAQINAGLVLIPGVPGAKIRVTDYIARVIGTFATGTAVILESTNGTPVLVSTLAEAGIAGTAVLKAGGANQTLGAGFGLPLGAGDGLQVVNSGSAQTGGTSIEFIITYQIG